MAKFFDQNGEGKMIVKRKTKVLMILLLIFTMLASGFKTATVYAADPLKKGTVSVIKADGTPIFKEKQVQFGTDETAFDVLVNAVGAEKVEYQQYDFGKMIVSINGVSSDTGYWGFFVNNLPASVGADNYIPQNGDHITFKVVDSSIPSNVSLQVIGANGQSIYDSNPYNIEIAGKTTALQLLQYALGSDKVGLTDTQYGPMITSINGTVAQGNSYWAFYVNNEYASTGADSYQLKPNDKISFKYETNTPSTGDSSSETGAGNTSNPDPASSTVEFSQEKLQHSIDEASQYTLNNWSDDNIWGAIALKKIGKTIPSSFLGAIKTEIQSKDGNFHYITDAEKYTLGVLASGGNPTNIAGYNLVESIYNGDVTKQGLNGVGVGLLALDASNFTIPASATWKREKLISQLLSNQKADGHWSLSDNDSSSDIDITAMVLTALAPYKDQAEVKEKIQHGVSYLSSQYQTSKIDNSASASQVVIALSALGIDANNSSFTKDNVSLIKYLLSFQNTDGGFSWKSGGKTDTNIASQGFEALVAYQLYLQGEGSLFHLPLSNKVHSIEPPAQEGAKEGNLLPNTATNTENIVLLGALLVIIGMMLVYFNHKKKA